MQTSARVSRMVNRQADETRSRCLERNRTDVSALRSRVLHTHERSIIADLRKYAPLDVERDLNADLDDLEDMKDRLGMVIAFFLGDEVVATIRLIACGAGVTLAEKTWGNVTQVKDGFGARSWEVGRLIVAPEYRSGELLRRCLALALWELISRVRDAEYLHASCSPLMARLYRQIGFVTEEVVEGGNGLQHALIHARVDDVARALDLASLMPVSAPQWRPEETARSGFILKAA